MLMTVLVVTGSPVLPVHAGGTLNSAHMLELIF